MVTTKELTLLVEKYRSKTLDQYVGNENIKRFIQQYLSQNDIQNLIFYGRQTIVTGKQIGRAHV